MHYGVVVQVQLDNGRQMLLWGLKVNCEYLETYQNVELVCCKMLDLYL